ncbi:MAG: AMP-binding protein [Labilithrix sp.]|nr:AMP-binding protein [Labilithrix sp.]MCW5813323.1 AMP-binding protein [Labilithrix sp.]
MAWLHDVVDRHARERADAIALVCGQGGERITYRALAERTRGLAGWLARSDVGPGDRVAVVADAAPWVFELLVACSRRGAILAPLNPRLPKPELDSILAVAEPRLVLGARPAAVDVEPRTEATSPRASLVLLFTSGSTGKPKGALLTHENLLANARSTARAWDLSAADVAVADAPLFHTGGLNVLATPLLVLGGTVVVTPRFDARVSLDAMAREGATVAFGVPQMLERLAALGAPDAAPSVRLWLVGGAPCPARVADAFGDRLVVGFGMTECGPNCFRPVSLPARRDVVGVPTFDLEATLAPDGELLLRGPHVFAGYFRDDDATRAAFTDDGWLRTGDVLDASPDGWRVVGRTKELFISGGENVYPAEVERVLAAHPQVLACAVVGVPDETWGEAGVAFVVADDAPPEALRAFVRKHLAAFKVPREVRLVDELPRTPSGKVDRRALVARATRRPRS